MNLKLNLKLILSTLCLILTACQNIGPQRLKPERLNYNRAVHYTEKQQKLLNIVRLRYGDSPFFLNLDSIVTQFEFEHAATLGVTAQQRANLQGQGNVGLRYTEVPTVTYTPLGGLNYVKRILTPIDLRVIYFLLQSGWGASHILRIMVQKIGPIENAISAARSAPTHPPLHKEFLEFSDAMRKMQAQNNLGLSYKIVKHQFFVKVSFKNYSHFSAKWKKILRKIQVTESAPYFYLTSENIQRPHYVYLQTRTTLGLLNYLSKGVEVPIDHLAKGYAPSTYLENGMPFDWKVITFGMIKIKSSLTKPTLAFTAVKYKNYWFYIAQSDTNSKETFSLLNILMEVNQGKTLQRVPIFTVR